MTVKHWSSIPGLTVTDPAALKAWLDSTEHSGDCTAHSEGQQCCLDHLVALLDPPKGRQGDREVPAMINADTLARLITILSEVEEHSLDKISITIDELTQNVTIVLEDWDEQDREYLKAGLR